MLNVLPRRMHHLAIVCLTVLLPVSVWAAGLPAMPEAVTLYPARALMEVRESVPVTMGEDGRTAVRILLPAQADPTSLRLSAVTGTVADVSWERVPAVEQGAVEAMRKELQGLRRSLAAADGDLKTLDARMALWLNASVHEAVAAEMERLEASMDKRLTALTRARYDMELKQKGLAEEVRQLEERLRAVTGGEAQFWQVRAVLQDAPATAVLRYVYLLGGCGWQPAYRFEALPGQKRVAFAFEAAVTQSSGMDWKNARLTLATLERDISLDPPRLPGWLVTEQAPVRKMARGNGVMALQADVAMAPMAEVAPRKIELGTYAAWELGARTVPAGRRIMLPVQSESWSAEFSYTVRPSRDSKAYLTARPALAEPRELPDGEAVFLVDGALVGKRGFSLAGTEATLFFGADPQVTATLRLLDKQSGNKGIIGRKQTMVWAWEMDVRNNRNHPVAIRVEDPAPQSGHEDIRVELESSPRPAEDKDHVLVWSLELAPRSVETIAHSVTVTAPKDMAVDFGRGR